MLNGYRTREIFDIVGESYGISYGTLRNDVYAINKAHLANWGNRPAGKSIWHPSGRSGARLCGVGTNRMLKG